MMAILVECHDCIIPGMRDEIACRFAASHAITRIDRALAATTLPAWLQSLGHLLATWEWHMGPTPCLVMEPSA